MWKFNVFPVNLQVLLQLHRALRATICARWKVMGRQIMKRDHFLKLSTRWRENILILTLIQHSHDNASLISKRLRIIIWFPHTNFSETSRFNGLAAQPSTHTHTHSHTHTHTCNQYDFPRLACGTRVFLRWALFLFIATELRRCLKCLLPHAVLLPYCLTDSGGGGGGERSSGLNHFASQGLGVIFIHITGWQGFAFLEAGVAGSHKREAFDEN